MGVYARDFAADGLESRSWRDDQLTLSRELAGFDHWPRDEAQRLRELLPDCPVPERPRRSLDDLLDLRTEVRPDDGEGRRGDLPRR